MEWEKSKVSIIGSDWGTSTGTKYAFIKQTIIPKVAIWVKPISKGNYQIQKITDTTVEGTRKFTFDTKYITEFKTSKEAREWVDKEYEYSFGVI